ncbi:hypothetical protein Lesp02_70240 [Lentzea sp. NBRC 105346]|uniref:hypothetical protein n=1 Tax=Lentzea sp. NBRC 105346 TaxID=3032205 RepID=UPI0024A2143C|nr:hypothetical protein [Lentzea sp. NBRC 105346]GLZ34837.1 hypothetical protein Lesp02_70240 [Lentzea sp. NBRC 105346]
MTTAYDTGVSRTDLAEAEALSRLHSYLRVDVKADPTVPEGQCEWCGNVGALTRNRVTAIPNPHETTATFEELCCHHCLKSVVDSAVEAHWSKAGRDVLVEVAL